LDHVYSVYSETFTIKFLTCKGVRPAFHNDEYIAAAVSSISVSWANKSVYHMSD